MLCFNTASGKYCCNENTYFYIRDIIKVSIPQAVSTVATIDTFENEKGLDVVSIPQAVSTVATKKIR